MKKLCQLLTLFCTLARKMNHFLNHNWVNDSSQRNILNYRKRSSCLTLIYFCFCFFFFFQVIVQNYNSVLTLSHLYQSSDALLVHENDVIHKICAQLMHIKQISFRDVNQVIAHQLGSVFQPAHTAEAGLHYSRNPLGI